jgi:hypothetical protein
MTRPDSVEVTAGNPLPGRAHLARLRSAQGQAPRRANGSKATCSYTRASTRRPACHSRAPWHSCSDHCKRGERRRDAGQLQRPRKTPVALVVPGDHRAAALGDRSGPAENRPRPRRRRLTGAHRHSNLEPMTLRRSASRELSRSPRKGSAGQRPGLHRAQTSINPGDSARLSPVSRRSGQDIV